MSRESNYGNNSGDWDNIFIEGTAGPARRLKSRCLGAKPHDSAVPSYPAHGVHLKYAPTARRETPVVRRRAERSYRRSPIWAAWPPEIVQLGNRRPQLHPVLQSLPAGHGKLADHGQQAGLVRRWNSGKSSAERRADRQRLQHGAAGWRGGRGYSRRPVSTRDRQQRLACTVKNERYQKSSAAIAAWAALRYSPAPTLWHTTFRAPRGISGASAERRSVASTVRGWSGFRPRIRQTQLRSPLRERHSSPYQMTWPTTPGGSGQCLTSSGGGTTPMTWGACSGFAPGSPPPLGNITPNTMNATALTYQNIPGVSFLVSHYAGMQAAINAAYNNGSVLGTVIDDRTSPYTGPGFILHDSVTLKLAPTTYTINGTVSYQQRQQQCDCRNHRRSRAHVCWAQARRPITARFCSRQTV